MAAFNDVLTGINQAWPNYIRCIRATIINKHYKPNRPTFPLILFNIAPLCN